MNDLDPKSVASTKTTVIHFCQPYSLTVIGLLDYIDIIPYNIQVTKR